MALLHTHFFAESLGMCCTMDVILPQPGTGELTKAAAAGTSRREYPCLWLLHGLSDDHSIWQRRTSIERYVAPLGLAVVMPNVHRSFYTDMANGYKYWTFISEELPLVARALCPLSARREDNFVAGLSMGGYGAFKLGLNRPERYAAAASLSGALDMAGRCDQPEHWLGPDLRLVYGDRADIRGTEHDLFAGATRLAQGSAPRPRLFQCCGQQDALYPSNVRFRDHARQLGLDLVYEEGPGGHDWGYWDVNIQHVLAWLPLAKK